MHIGDYITVGDSDLLLRVGYELKEMVDSTHLLNDPKAIVKVIERDGYALLRGVLPRDKVLAARRVVTDCLDREWGIIETSGGRPAEEAWIKDEAKGVLLTGYREVTHHPSVSTVLAGKHLVSLFRSLFGETPATFDNIWVRIHGKGESSDEHTDYYRFALNAEGMYVCWVPFGDYNVKQGCLAICEGTHKLNGYEEHVYGKETKVELPPDYFSFRHKATWRSTTYRAGDICVFDIRTIHASTVNTTDRFRISMDVRWQPARFVPEVSRSMFRVFETDPEDSG